MLRVIRNRAGLYLKQDGKWIENLGDAKHFPDAMSAINARIQFHLKNVELVLIMNAEPSNFDVALPMADGE